MLKVLIIEDDEFKQRRLAQAVKSYDYAWELFLERSVNAGLSAIEDKHPDLILLDMSLTTFDVGPAESGGRPQNFGGLEVLRQMDRLEICIPVIVITQHERFARGSQEVLLSTIRTELEEQHDRVFKGLVYYNSATGNWEKQLRGLIREILKQGDKRRDNKSSARRR